MFENRSFDHLFGFMKGIDPRIEGLTGKEFNYPNPNAPTAPVPVSRATTFAMPFDPGHEFDDVQVQLYGPNKTPPPRENPPIDPALLTGFIASAAVAAQEAHVPDQAGKIMECFQPDQIPVLSTLAKEFAVFNFWFSSLPGPTWPNRFFVHAATSGGLHDSPDTERIVAGFSFPNGTIYNRLDGAGKNWRIYHNGMPQTAGIDELRIDFINPFSKHFKEMDDFIGDVKSGSLPEYTFIEPNYDTGHNYQGGDSMHPLNDIRKGEALLKQVYEAIRNSVYWTSTMLIVIFDEHGGFYDHVPPVKCVPTGDDKRYCSTPFAFDHYGIRVPAIVVSAFTQRGTVLGSSSTDPASVFDHSSVLATVEKRFGLKPLTQRDSFANTLEVTLNLTNPRSSPTDAPPLLPSPTSDSLFARVVGYFKRQSPALSSGAKLSMNQQSLLDLALSCDLKMNETGNQSAIRERHRGIKTQGDAAAYIAEIDSKIRASRHR